MPRPVKPHPLPTLLMTMIRSPKLLLACACVLAASRLLLDVGRASWRSRSHRLPLPSPDRSFRTCRLITVLIRHHLRWQPTTCLLVQGRPLLRLCKLLSVPLRLCQSKKWWVSMDSRSPASASHCLDRTRSLRVQVERRQRLVGARRSSNSNSSRRSKALQVSVLEVVARVLSLGLDRLSSSNSTHNKQHSRLMYQHQVRISSERERYREDSRRYHLAARRHSASLWTRLAR